MHNLQLQDIPIGSHLVAHRVGLLNYDHHAVYIGNNEVIHYGSWVIKKASLSDFLQNSTLIIMQHVNPKYSNAEAVERAHTEIGKRKYNILFNNCEHFVNWCIDDKKESRQANIACQAVAAIVLLFLGILVVYKVFSKEKQTTA